MLIVYKGVMGYPGWKKENASKMNLMLKLTSNDWKKQNKRKVSSY
ncbi:hypothetical protein [Salirhabdus salicampi]|nr:hypothetical protein [Salirhabdus salicampi]